MLIQDLSQELDSKAMTDVRGGNLVEPIGGSVLPPLPPGLPPCVVKELGNLFPPAPPERFQPL
jgi:hypothetical protein